MADQDAPKLGATFLPGGYDDYYMPVVPDVVSPAPQRKLAELGDQIQQSIAALELEGASSTAKPEPPRKDVVARPEPQAAARPEPPTPHTSRMLEPNISLFPRLAQRTPNVPPSDEEKGTILSNARLPVLSSTDAEVQLTWANDALTFVDISAENDRRMGHLFGTRPPEPLWVQQMRTDAIGIVEFLANQNHPRAEFMKALWLEFGKFGYKEDKAEAFRIYKRAAEKGFARAEYRMGMLFESTNQPNEALLHYRAGEKVGDSAACYRLGMTHLLGQLGQPEDFPVAVQLIRYAAEHADENAPQGAYVYGMLLANELPQVTIPAPILPPDLVGARTHLERSAFLGFSKAQVKMGSAYELCGLGCAFDPALSLHYNKLAAQQGEPEAELAISKWFLCGAAGVFNKHEATAFYFAERAAAEGLDTAEFAMGYFKEVGVSCPINMDAAMQWYRKAAAKGNKDAAGRIDALQKKNPLSKSDHEQIAVQRIRSTHASKRGGRPDRLTQAPPRLPAIADQAAIPSNTAPYTHPPNHRPVPTPNPAPPRASSVAPYPLEDRPASIAPYPVGESMRPVSNLADPISGYYDAVQRPVSTAVDGRGGPRPPTGQQPAALPPQDPRSGYGTPAGRVPPGQRVVGRRPAPTGSPLPPPKERFSNDFGYTAPGEMRKAAGTPNFGVRPAAPASTNSSPNVAQQHRRNQSGQLTAPPADPSGRRASTGTPASSAAPGGSAKSNKPLPATTPARPPGKGPQTFEQMGIPASKNENDCLVM